MLDDADLALVSRLVREGVAQAIEGRLPTARDIPGTVPDAIAAGAAGQVLVDGDTVAIAAHNATGHALGAAARVLVRITPSGAVWITNALGAL